MPSLRIKRGTRAQLNSAASGSSLRAGEPYLITDESRFAIGLTAGTYQSFLKEGEVSGTGDMLASVYDPNGDGKVNSAVNADEVPWTGVSGKPTTYPPESHTHSISNVTGLQDALDGKQATLVSGDNIKTIAGQSVLGPGNLSLENSINTLTYTYTGAMYFPPIGCSPWAFIPSPSGKERFSAIEWESSSANTNLTSIEFPNLEIIGIHGRSGVTSLNNFRINGLPAVTSISFPSLKFVGGGFSPGVVSACTTLNMPLLEAIEGSCIVNSMAALTTLNVSSLVTVGIQLNLGGSLTSLNLNSLAFVGSSMSISVGNTITNLSYPSLTKVGFGFSHTAMSSLVTINAPALQVIFGQFTVVNTPALTTVALSALEYLGSGLSSGFFSIDIVTGAGALTNFVLPSTLKSAGGPGVGVRITSAALNQESVDSILVRLAALDGTNGTTAFSSRTVTITGTSSAPSAAGLAAKATLVARGCTVTHN